MSAPRKQGCRFHEVACVWRIEQKGKPALAAALRYRDGFGVLLNRSFESVKEAILGTPHPGWKWRPARGTRPESIVNRNVSCTESVIGTPARILALSK